MRAVVYALHAMAPERRKLSKVAEVVRQGGVILYPSDTGFALGCQLSNKGAIQRLRSIRRIDDRKFLTFLCSSLSDLAEFAMVDDPVYRLLKRLVPGPITFVLTASKNVPRYAQNPRRKTAGIRVTDDSISRLLLEQLEEPLISITAKTPEGNYLDDPDELVAAFARQVDAAVTLDSYSFEGESTVLDLSGSTPEVLRQGAGYERVLDNVDLLEG